MRNVPERDKSWASLEDGSFSSFFWDRIGYICVNAAEEGWQKKDGDDGKDTAAGSSGKREQMGGGDSTKVETVSRRNKTEMNKEAKLLSCTLLNGSAWSTGRMFMTRYKGKCDSSLGLNTD